MRLYPLTQAMAFVAVALLLTACGNDSESDTIPTVIDGTPPLLTTDSGFTDGYTAVAAVFVSGQVQDSSGIKSLTYSLNEKPMQRLTTNTEGYFNDRILLSLGSNKITLEATDNAGNIMRSTKTIYLGDTIAAGGAHTGALRDGQLYGWGRNNYGQTGLGLTTKISDVMGHPDTPMMMNTAPKDLLSISFNQNHSLAIDRNGQVYSWGEDKYGQLGRGETGRNDCSQIEDCRLDISPIKGIENALMVAAGYKHNLVLTKDGHVWAFGDNSHGQLGNAPAINTANSHSTTNSSTPVKVDFSKVEGVGHIVQVVASANSSYALDDKGQVWGWGSDAYANLGKGTACTVVHHCVDINTTPIRIHIIDSSQVKSSTAQNIEKVTQLAAGRDHVLALTNNEAVYGWGLNATSQLGYNGETFHGTEGAWADIVATPTKLLWFTDKAIRRVYANGNASYALLDNITTSKDSSTDGVIYAWGTFGQTNGAGETIYNDLDEPTNNLPNLKNIDNLAMGAMHLIAHEKPLNQGRTTDSKNGYLFTWGWSFEGSLGNKDTAHIWMYNTPIPVSLLRQI